MSIKKTLTALSIATVFGLGGQGLAMAQDDNVDAQNRSASANDDSTAVAVADSANDNSVHDESIDVKVEDSLNDNSDNSANFRDSFNETVKLNARVAVGVLEGAVGYNVQVNNESKVSADNNISQGAIENVSGISQLSQNNGANSLVQQNVTVQGNVGY
ncbi:MAG: hypothetical protein WED00_11420 [Aquisalimonadaceae bacterium]